jgi:hemolysin activation/secretion protein
MYSRFNYLWLKTTVFIAVAMSYYFGSAIYAFSESETTQEPETSKQLVQTTTEANTTTESYLEYCPYEPAPLPVNNISFPVFQGQLETSLVIIQISGSTVLSQSQILADEQIQNLIQTYQGRTLTGEQLNQIYQDFAQAITQLYLNQGYITSKATPVLPISITEEGIIDLPVVEGRLEAIELQGRGRLTLNYICSRIGRGVSSPVNITKLEEQLRLLNNNSLFDNVEASLQGTGKAGLSLLKVTVAEANTFKGNLSGDNYSPPSLGSERVGIGASYGNVTGLGDTVAVNYYNSTTDGNKSLDFSYQIPLNPMEGSLQLRISPQWTKITLAPIDQLDITGNNQVYQITYRQPLILNLKEEFALSLGFQYQDGRTLGLGGLQSLESSNSQVIQFSQDYTSRDLTGIWVVRSQFNLGFSDINRGDFGINDTTPDGSFFSWLAQLQRLQRLGDNNLLILQADLQLSADPLPSYYLFIIGGGQSVRGYRQNARSGDNGFRISIEDRITLVSNEKKQPVFQVAPFIDMGQVWNAAGNPFSLPSQTFLFGTGLGLLWNPVENLSLRLDYGIPWVNLKDRGNNLQSDGLYFQINLSN